MKKIYFYFLFFCVLMATPSDFTSVSEVFMGSEEGKYYTVISEILNPGSYYIYKKNTYLAVYRDDNSLISKRILKQEDIVLDDDAKESKKSVRILRNKGTMENLLKKDIDLSISYFINMNEHEMRNDGIYENFPEEDKKPEKIFSKEEIDKKIKEICNKNYCGENTDYNYENLEILSGYYNRQSSFYIIRADFDIVSINFIMRKNR